ncbi:MAG: NIPSNAP family protein [Burkholderiales bacterium]
MPDATATPSPATDRGPYYELRLYEMVQGRMAHFHDLMGRRVPPLFARHGFTPPLGIWESHAGPVVPLYAYLLRWPSLDARMQAWGRFYSDPEWIEALAANYAGQQRVERAHIAFLRASPLWAGLRSAAVGKAGGRQEMRRYDLRGLDEPTGQATLSAELAALQASGAVVLGVFDMLIGASCPQAVVFLAWPATAAPQPADSLPCDTFLLQPVPYGAAQHNFGSTA